MYLSVKTTMSKSTKLRAFKSSFIAWGNTLLKMKEYRITVLSTLFFVFIGFSQTANAQHWSIENIAGDGTSDFFEGNSPLENGFIIPRAIAKDSEKNIYFTSFNLVGVTYVGSIYKLSADYSTIVEIVPDVTPLTGIAIDKNDNLYFSKGEGGTDGYNFEYIHVRRPDGTYELFAGNGLDEVDDYPESGETAFGVPIGNAGSLKVITESDGDEYLYYSSTLQDNNFIQKVNIETGITYRVAGIPYIFDADTYDAITDGDLATDSYLNITLGLGSDSKGNVYYFTGPSGADAYSIKKIVDGKIYHVAGTGESGYGGDGDLAKDATLATNTCGFTIVNDTMYICDIGNKVIRRFELSTTDQDDGTITTIAGTGFDEDEGEISNNISGIEIQSSVNTNMAVIDLVYIDGDFILSDINSRIRKMYWCTNPEPGPIAVSKTDLCLGDVVELSIEGDLNGGGFWRWYKDECSEDDTFIGSEPSLEITAQDNTSYFVIGLGGCAYKSECEEIEIELACQNYYNTITPNSDGKNDFLEIPVLDNFPTNNVVLYNRWGDMLEEFENYDSSTIYWEGTNGNGDPVDSGTYFFTATSESELIVSGWVQVVRD